MNSPIASPAPPERAMVSVDANALRQILVALDGPSHLIREITMTRSVAALTGEDPIGTLIEDFNAAVERAAETPVQAQLGTGSGAGAQSDSGADSGHFARAVQSEGSTAREALRAITEVFQWDEIGATEPIEPWSWESAARMCSDIARAALATVEAKEKTR